MYPFTANQIYVRNAWYIAAFSHEVSRDPMQRTIMDEPIVLYRTEAGEARAMWGLCPHRNFPLAEGTLIGDELQCAYHGFCFNVNGAVTRIPGQATVPKAFRQRVYPVIERGGFVWLWMGKAAEADTSRMPPIKQLGAGQPGWTMVPNEVTPIPARWPLMIDNLMDLSHIGFLHLQSIDAPGAGEAPPEIADDANFSVTRFLPGQDSTMPYVRYAFPHRKEPVDVEIATQFLTPGFLAPCMRFYEPGTGRKELLGTSYHLQGVTPESRTSTLGFSALLRDVQPDSADFDEWLRSSVRKTREEDKLALAHLERYTDQYADARRELAGINDVAGIRVRRHLSRLLDDEERAAAASK